MIIIMSTGGLAKSCDQGIQLAMEIAAATPFTTVPVLTPLLWMTIHLAAGWSVTPARK